MVDMTLAIFLQSENATCHTTIDHGKIDMAQNLTPIQLQVCDMFKY